jgi:hypothetical protein
MLHIFFIMAMISRIYLFLLACLVRITAHSCPVLLLPDFLQPFSIKTDASNSGIAAKREAGRSLRKVGHTTPRRRKSGSSATVSKGIRGTSTTRSQQLIASPLQMHAGG